MALQQRLGTGRVEEKKWGHTHVIVIKELPFLVVQRQYLFYTEAKRQ